MRALIVSQVFHPEPGSVGEHMAEAAVELARRGVDVRVITSQRGYDDPTLVFPARENYHGVDIVRVPWSSFGKQSIARRVAGSLGFVAQSTLRSLRGFRPDVVIVGTSPPLSSMVGYALASWHEAPLLYWVMDVNPDQIVALGRLPASHPAVIALGCLNGRVASAASHVVVLDDDMAERMLAKGAKRKRLTILPPWPLDDYVQPVAHADNPFRREHGLDGKRVFMFSGNLSTASPLTTVVEAARRMRDLDSVRFVVVGGGQGKKLLDAELAERPAANIISLPYEPLERLKFSLSAADVHIVSLGDPMRGIVHPSKLYGAMAAARPILYLGPQGSHIDRVVTAHDMGWRISHGDVEKAERVMRGITNLPQAEITAKGQRAWQVLTANYSKSRLCGEFCNVVERVARERQYIRE